MELSKLNQNRLEMNSSRRSCMGTGNRQHKFEDGVPMTAELSLRSIQKASDSAYIATSGDISCTCGFMVRVFTGS